MSVKHDLVNYSQYIYREASESEVGLSVLFIRIIYQKIMKNWSEINWSRVIAIPAD